MSDTISNDQYDSHHLSNDENNEYNENDPLNEQQYNHDHNHGSSDRERDDNNNNIPYGQWKDSIWDCFRFGYCHTTIWMGCCCIPCAAAQVAIRINMYQNDFCFYYNKYYLKNNNKSNNLPYHSNKVMNTKFYFQLMKFIIIYYTIRLILFIIIFMIDPNKDNDNVEEDFIKPPYLYYVLCGIDDFLWLIYCIYSIIVIYRVRTKLRQLYSIPSSLSTAIAARIDDCFCSIICPTLSMMQILRHTANYDIEKARCCCSPSGLREKATADMTSPNNINSNSSNNKTNDVTSSNLTNKKITGTASTIEMMQTRV